MKLEINFIKIIFFAIKTYAFLTFVRLKTILAAFINQNSSAFLQKINYEHVL
jgi:hypothetical protein